MARWLMMFWPLVWLLVRTESLLHINPSAKSQKITHSSSRKRRNSKFVGKAWSPPHCCSVRLILATKRYSSTLSSSSSSSSSSNEQQQQYNPLFQETVGVGIDLGTTNSAVAYMEQDRPVIISVDHARTIPSVVAFVNPPGGSENINTSADATTSRSSSAFLNINLDDNYFERSSNRTDTTTMVLVGREAAFQDFCYRNVKRIIGTGGNAPPLNVGKVVPGVFRNPQGKTYRKNNLANRLYDAIHHPTKLQYRVNNKNSPNQSKTSFSSNSKKDETNNKNNTNNAFISPEQVSSYILRKLINAAQAHTGKRVDRAVIGIPAYFDDAQTNATIEAGRLAGIPKVKLMREPEAAALAYQYTQDQKTHLHAKTNRRNEVDNDDDLDELLLAFDLGGGTYDVSVLRRIGGGVTEIICTAGDAQLGGSVWDARLADYLQNAIRQQPSSSSSSNGIRSAKAQSNLVLVAEALRIYLSNHKKAVMRLPKTDAGWCGLVDSSGVETTSNTTTTMPPTTNRRLNKNLLQHIFVEPEHGPSSNNNNDDDDESIVITMTRSEMEKVCEAEWLALLRPLREVAIMAGVLLAGDARPSAVAAALELEEEETKLMKQQQQQQQQERRFDEFYDEEGVYQEDRAISIENNPLLEAALRQEIDAKAAKKAQQKGRKKARVVAKKEQRFQQEKRKVAEQITPAEYLANTGVKVRDGIPGRPISRIVLVGGATRMPAIGRLLTQLTGVVPEKTVNPDEAVALGCAVKVAMLDGSSSVSQSMLLNPMQAAILKALAIRDGKDKYDDDDDDNYEEVDEDDDFL